MKKQFFLILFLTATLYSAAQTNRDQPAKRWTFSALAGPAFPVGDFYGINKVNPRTGPVQTGGVSEFSADYWLNRYIGITLLASGQLNKGNGFPFDIDQPDGHFLPFSGSSRPDEYWKTFRLLTGATFAIPLNKKQNLDLLIRLLGGVQRTKSANYYTTAPGDPTIGYSQPGVNLPWAFSGQADAGLRWRTTKHLAVIAYAGYNGYSAKHTMDYIIGGEPYSDITIYPGTARFSTSSLLLRLGMQVGL